jgi:hypothetical protein
MYLHCITSLAIGRTRGWVDWLWWAEYCYNTYHTTLHTTPFQVVYDFLAGHLQT